MSGSPRSTYFSSSYFRFVPVAPRPEHVSAQTALSPTLSQRVPALGLIHPLVTLGPCTPLGGKASNCPLGQRRRTVSACSQSLTCAITAPDRSVHERPASCSALCPLGLKRHPCACLPVVPPGGAGKTTPAGAIILYSCWTLCSPDQRWRPSHAIAIPLDRKAIRGVWVLEEDE